VKNLIAARVTADRRYTLLNRELAIHRLEGDTERRTLETLDELAEALQRHFLIDVPAEMISMQKLGRALRSP
jgi:N-hydroxyarylamine O-acetyltransferase